MKLLFVFIAGLSMLITGSEPIKNSFGHNQNASPSTNDVGEEFDCCGGQEENPVIWATVYDAQYNLLQGANVDVYDNSTSTILGGTTTASDGTFAVQVDNGEYYFEITPAGSSTSTTSVYTVTGSDLTVNIYL